MTGGQRALAQVRTASALCLVLTVLVTASTGWGAPTLLAAPVLAAAVAGTELAVVHLHLGRQRWTFSLTEAVVGAALVLAPGGWTVGSVALGVLVAQHVRHQPLVKLQYNVAQLASATAVAAAVATAAGGGVLGAAAGLAAFFAVNHVLVALVVALTTDRGLPGLLRDHAVVSALHTAGNSSIGLLAAYLAEAAPAGLLGLLVPLALLWASYDQEARRAAEARLYAELARGQEQASTRSTHVSAQVVVTAAARLLGGAQVELLMVAADGPVRYVGGGTQPPVRLRVDQEAFDQPWVLRALASGRVSTGADRGRPWCSAVLGEAAPGEAPLAVLVVRRPSGAAAFGRAEVRIAEVLAGQAETWLSVSDLSERHRAAARQVAAADGAAKALADLGARTSPALTVLRESAGRLADLTADEAGVDEVVEELHLVERAVASLLGAVALHAEPGLSGDVELDDVPAAKRASDDWTTTGLLS